MQVSCVVEKKKASEGLVDSIRALGIEPIVTPLVIRTVYEGNDEKLGDAIVNIYEKELDHSIVAIKPTTKSKKRKNR